MKTILIIIVVISAITQAAVCQSFYIRKSDTGCLRGPYECKEGTQIQVDLLPDEQATFVITFPLPEELEMLTRLRSIVLPTVDFRQTLVSNALETLVAAQNQTTNVPIIIRLNLAGYRRPDKSFPLDLRPGFVVNREDKMEYDNTVLVPPLVTFRGRDLSLYDALDIIAGVAHLKVIVTPNDVILSSRE